MRFVRATSTATLCLLFGAILPTYAQHDKQNERESKPQRQQGEQRQAAPHQQQQQRAQQPQRQQPQHQQRAQQPQRQQPHQQRAQQTQRQQPHQQRAQQRQSQQPQRRQTRRSQQAYQQQQPHRTRQQAVTWQRQRGWQQQGGWHGHSNWQEHRAQRWDTDHRTWAQRGGYGGYYIPQDRFSLYFGIGHGFRMHRRPTMYMGYPRFSYGGFSFLLVDPWPEYWSPNWYDTDDLYIGYDDGYYLYNRRYPSMGLAITVAL